MSERSLSNLPQFVRCYIGYHFKFWCVIGFGACWLILSLQTQGELWATTIAAFIGTAVIFFVLAMSFFLHLTLGPIAILSLAIIGLLMKMEDRNQLIEEHKVLQTELAAMEPPPMRESNNSGSYLLPLIIGIWIGHEWGNGD